MSNSSNLFTFLKEHRLNKVNGDNATHVAMAGTHTGTYNIPVEKLAEFYKLYREAKKTCHIINLIEKHDELCPVIIDFDFKFTDEYNYRLYTVEMVKNVVNAYIAEIKTIWNVSDEELNAYVFARDDPYFTKHKDTTILKDGFHIMFPHIVSKPDAQLYLRTKILLKMPEILQSLPLINTIDDVVDKSVIKSNGWFLYGSCKPLLPEYKLTDIYNHLLENVEKPTDESHLTEFLSIRGKTTATPLFKDVEDDLLYEQSQLNKDKTKTYKQIENIESDDYKNNILYLLSNLNDACYDDFETWRNIMWFMHKNGLDAAYMHEYSSRSNKYGNGECVNKLINSYDSNKCNVNIGTMFYYMKTHGCDINIYNKCISLFKNVNIISLDDINADENINLNNIGSYLPRLEKADVVCLRSNMMTFKTQNLKELVNHYKKIVIVSFRVSLDEAYIKEFGEFGFILYSDIKGKITDDRVVVQIDSLHKLRGKYDLLILDEMVYTIDHMVSFVKEKKLVWDTLIEYIKETKKIIVCDALLNNTVIQLFKDIKRKTIQAPKLDNIQPYIVEDNEYIDNPDNLEDIGYFKYDNLSNNTRPQPRTFKVIKRKTLLNYTQTQLYKDLKLNKLSNNTPTQPIEDNTRDVYVVDNEWKSFDGYTAEVIVATQDIKEIKEIFILDVLQLLTDGQKVVVPITSIKKAKELIGTVNNKLPHIKICFISKDTDLISPTEWGKYDLLVYSPTIAAGVSYNEEYFNNRICYFSNQSASCELACQMIFRVRNSSCKNIKIYVSEKGNMKNETDGDKLDKWIRDIDKLDVETGLNVSRVYDEIIKDEYYNIYKNHISRRNLSKNNFAGVLCGILDAHGIKTNIVKPNIPTELENNIKELKAECKKISKNNETDDALNVINARILSDEEADLLNDAYKKTTQQKFELRKYHILKTYGDRELTTEFVKKYEGLTAKYYNICEFAKPDFETEIKEKIQNKEICTENVKRLHKSNRDLKLHWTNEMIKMIGYTDIFDKKHINGFPYEKVKKYLVDNGDKVALLFNTNKKDWMSVVLDAKGKKSISEYINGRLREVANIRVINKHKGASSKYQEYVIHGINEWGENNISFIQKETKIKMDDCCLFKVDMFPEL